MTQLVGPIMLIPQVSMMIQKISRAECLACSSYWLNERFVVVVIANANKEQSPSQPQGALGALPGRPDVASPGASLGDCRSLSSTKPASD